MLRWRSVPLLLSRLAPRRAAYRLLPPTPEHGKAPEGASVESAEQTNGECSKSRNAVYSQHPFGQPGATLRKSSSSRSYSWTPLALLAAGLTGAGYLYSYCLENKITVADIMRRFETFNDWSHERMQALLDKHFPHSSEPLLPDLKELNFPENFPTLVVDLDKVIVKMEHDRAHGWRVVKRPGADRFFKELAFFYHIVVWSDDAFPVAQEVCFKWGVPIIGALHKDQCLKRAGGWVKDLSRLGRRLDRVIIIDHDPRAFMLQPENGIQIKEFEGDENDKELDCLVDFLTMAATSPDDIRKTIMKFGGGDLNLGKRWMAFKSDQEKRAENRRTLGRAFGGNLSYSWQKKKHGETSHLNKF